MAQLTANDVLEVLKFTSNCVNNCLDFYGDEQQECTFKCLNLLNTTVGFAQHGSCSTALVPTDPSLHSILYLILTGMVMLFKWLFKYLFKVTSLPEYIYYLIIVVVPKIWAKLYNICVKVSPVFGFLSFIILLIKVLL